MATDSEEGWDGVYYNDSKMLWSSALFSSMLLVRTFRPDFSCNLLVWIPSISNDKSKRWRTIPFVDQRWEWCPGRLSDRIHPLHSVQLIAGASHLGLLST